jgi:hypothetical protein
VVDVQVLQAALAQTLIRAAVADTLRTVAEWGQMSREELRGVAEAVDSMVVEQGLCCPVCQEVHCDEGCPLESVRRGLV